VTSPIPLHLLATDDAIRSCGVSKRTFETWNVPVTFKYMGRNYYAVKEILGAVKALSESSELAVRKLEVDVKVQELKAEQMELKLSKDRAEVVPVTLLGEILTEVASQMAPMLEPIHIRVKQRHPSLPASAVDQIKLEVVKAMNLLAEVDKHVKSFVDNYCEGEL